MKELLNKKNTALLHGIAILMMIYHHLFITGNTWFIDHGTSLLDVFNKIDIFNNGQAQLTFAYFCKKCVAIFAFTSGYAICAQLDARCKEKVDIKTMLSYCLKRFLSFYKKYVLVFAFFISCEYFMGNQNNLDLSFSNIVLNLIGVRATLNATWWYVLVYYYMILVSPFVYILLKKLNLKGYLIVIGFMIVLAIVLFVTGNIKLLTTFVQHYEVGYVIIFMEGMFCFRYRFLDYLASKLNVFTSLLILVVTYVVRALLIRAPSDWFFDIVLIVPFVLGTLSLFNKTKYINKVLEFLGKYSTYMWLSHAYFYSYLFFNLVFRADMSLLVYIQVILYSLLTSIVFTYIEKLIFVKLLNNKI